MFKSERKEKVNKNAKTNLFKSQHFVLPFKILSKAGDDRYVEVEKC